MAIGSNYITADNAAFYYSGRIDFSNPKRPVFSYSGVRIRTQFEGTSASMVIRSYIGEIGNSDNYFYCIVDSRKPNRIKITTVDTLFSLATGLADTVHSLELIKLTECLTGNTEF
ncbi:MAG: hypothetical protein HC896_14500 [Bacteroidales bacterium]|nr:hypothetical protein [Bacteroidales bacterium]